MGRSGDPGQAVPAVGEVVYTVLAYSWNGDQTWVSSVHRSKSGASQAAGRRGSVQELTLRP